jgi:hypothetical protein
LGQAERDYKRAQQLFEGKLISQELFEDSRTKFDLAKNELALREKSFELIIERLRKTEVMAPFDSTILTRPISVGQAVSGSGGFNAGTEVLTIANLNDLIVNAHINQADVTRLHVDQQVEVSVEAVSGLKVIGKVERIAPQSTLKNNIRGFAARILLKDVGNQIRPGMSANISIPVASADNVVAALGIVHLAMVREPEAAMAVEHDVIRPAQHAAKIAGLVEHLNRAGVDIDPLDPSAGIIIGNAVRRIFTFRAARPVEAAIVGAIELAVWPEREAIGTATGLRHHVLATIGPHTCDLPQRDFRQDDTAIRHRHGSFGEGQSVSYNLHTSLSCLFLFRNETWQADQRKERGKADQKSRLPICAI